MKRPPSVRFGPSSPSPEEPPPLPQNRPRALDLAPDVGAPIEPIPEATREGQERLSRVVWLLRKHRKNLLISAGILLSIGLLGMFLFEKDPPPSFPDANRLQLKPGESLMLSLPFDVSAPPMEIQCEGPSVVKSHIYLMQTKPQSRIHILLTAGDPGQTEWTLLLQNGGTHRYLITVNPPASAAQVLPALERQMMVHREIEEGNRLMKRMDDDPSAAYAALNAFRSASTLLGNGADLARDPLALTIKTSLADLSQRWREQLACAERTLTIARINGNPSETRAALQKLLEICPNRHSAEHQKYRTLLNYVYPAPTDETAPQNITPSEPGKDS